MDDPLKLAREFANGIWGSVNGDIDAFKKEYMDFILDHDEIYTAIAEDAINRHVVDVAHNLNSKRRTRIWHAQPQRVVDRQKGKDRVGVMANVQHEMLLMEINIIHGSPGKAVGDAVKPEIADSKRFYLTTGGDYIYKGRWLSLIEDRLPNDTDPVRKHLREKDLQGFRIEAQAPIPMPTRRSGRRAA